MFLSDNMHSDAGQKEEKGICSRAYSSYFLWLQSKADFEYRREWVFL